MQPVPVRQASLADLKVLVPLFDGYRQFYGQPCEPQNVRAFLHQRLTQGDSVLLLADADGRGHPALALHCPHQHRCPGAPCLGRGSGGLRRQRPLCLRVFSPRRPLHASMGPFPVAGRTTAGHPDPYRPTFWRRQVAGDCPVARLKARLKAASDS